MPERKNWAPRKRQPETSFHLPYTRREYRRLLKGRAMLGKVFLEFAGRKNNSRGIENAVRSFCVRLPSNGYRPLSFEEKASLVIRGLHLFPVKKFHEPFAWILIAEVVKQNPKKFGIILGKSAGIFSNELGGQAHGFILALGPHIEQFFTGLGPHVREFAEGMRESFSRTVQWTAGFEENLARGLGKNAGHFAEGLGPAAEYVIPGLASSYESIFDRKSANVFVRGLGKNCALLAKGLGKYADAVADRMKKNMVSPETIRLLTGKIR